MIKVEQINPNAISYLVRGLDNFEKDKAIKEGLRKGGNVFKTGGRRRLKSSMRNSRGVTGNLLSSFHVRVKRQKLGMLVGFRRSTRNMQIGGGNHAHLVDEGTDKRYWKTRGRKSTGRMTATRFWSDTKIQEWDSASSKIFEGIESAVERIRNNR